MNLIYICVNVPLTINDRKFHVDFTNECRGDIHYFGAKTFGIYGKIKVNGNHTMGLLCCLQHFLFFFCFTSFLYMQIYAQKEHINKPAFSRISWFTSRLNQSNQCQPIQITNSHRTRS